MTLAEKAFSELFPEKTNNYQMNLRYSAKFTGYNANVRQSGRKLIFSLSRKWETIDEDIQMGIIQSLLCKLFRVNRTTMNLEMYNNFLKNVHVSIPESDSEPELKESFERINDRFFDGTMVIASLIWSNKSKRCFGSYDYGTDTIKINPLLSGHAHLLDYVMYHEMLHKRFKFNVNNNRSYHHTKEFRQAEDMYPEKDSLEKELSRIANGRQRRKKCVNLFDWF